MNTNDLLLKAHFCSVIPREFLLDSGEKLKYYCCKKANSISCQKHCESCQSIYARYIIIDLCEEKAKQLCDQYLFSSVQNFEEFQKNHLAKMFFYESDAVRYNIYLVFLYDNSTEITNKEVILQNTNYARKLFLTNQEFREYFCFFEVAKELLDKNDFSNDRKILEKLSDIVKELDKKHAKAIVLPQKDIHKHISTLIDYLISNESQFDRFLGIRGTAIDFLRTHFYKKDDRTKTQTNRIERIKEIFIQKFRESCFSNNTRLPCGKVNVLVGSNAVGKSSILDAIEFGFTGETHRFKNDYSLQGARVEITTSDGSRYSNPSSQQTDRLKRQWYPYYLGSLNDLFCRINYFDTDATYRFALEQGGNKDAFAHIKRLLCNSQLLNIENSLQEYLRTVDVLVPRMITERDGSAPSVHSFMHRILKPSQKQTELQRDDVMEKKVQEFQKVCTETYSDISVLIINQISSNIRIINSIFRRLFSYNYNVIWLDETIQLKKTDDDSVVPINAMSTAQKVCLALSVIFTQFLVAEDSPRFILLDESVANLDSIHLLNLLDFLRELSLAEIQIFFTTANDEVAQVATSKFKFLGEEYSLCRVSRTKEGVMALDFGGA